MELLPRLATLKFSSDQPELKDTINSVVIVVLCLFCTLYMYVLSCKHFLISMII